MASARDTREFTEKPFTLFLLRAESQWTGQFEGWGKKAGERSFWRSDTLCGERDTPTVSGVWSAGLFSF